MYTNLLTCISASFICWYISDDEPQPGPSSYIVLSGFNETELLPQLSQVGIVVDVLIKITNLTETVLSG